MPAGKLIKIFRRPVDEDELLQTEVTMWLTVMESSGYLIQSMSQSTDVVTTYGVAPAPNIDVAHITLTFLALRLPTA